MDIYTEFSTEQAADQNFVKNAILIRYGLVSVAFGQKFRNFEKLDQNYI